MATPEIPREEAEAALQARRELGEEMEAALVAAFAERIERAVALFDQRKAPSLELVQRNQAVTARRCLAHPRSADVDDADGREQCTKHQRDRRRHAGWSAYRSCRRRASTGSGHSAISAPPKKTMPASQIRFTSGFTNAFS